MSAANRIGYLSSIGLFVVGVAYAVVVAFGISQAGLDHPIVDPTLGLMEALTFAVGSSHRFCDGIDQRHREPGS